MRRIGLVGLGNSLHYKDLAYALATARDLGAPTPLTAFVHEVFTATALGGDPLWIQPAIVTYWEKLAGVEVRGREADETT